MNKMITKEQKLKKQTDNWALLSIARQTLPENRTNEQRARIVSHEITLKKRRQKWVDLRLAKCTNQSSRSEEMNVLISNHKKKLKKQREKYKLQKHGIATLHCVQVHIKDQRSPILAPNLQKILVGEKFDYFDFPTCEEARNEYSKHWKSINRKDRKYLRESKYTKLYNKNSTIIDIENERVGVDLDVKLSCGNHTTVKIRNLKYDVEGIEKMKVFNENCNMQSLCRRESGDDGKMFAFGREDILNEYASMKKQNDRECKSYCMLMRKMLKKYFNHEIKDIMDGDRKQGIVPKHNMGGSNHGIGGYFHISKNLVNSAHYDLDTSRSVTVFLEKEPGKAKDWDFILPNTTKIEDETKAIAVKLFDGCAIGWDGRKVYHCTGMSEVGSENNCVYGNFFGGKKY